MRIKKGMEVKWYCRQSYCQQSAANEVLELLRRTLQTTTLWNLQYTDKVSHLNIPLGYITNSQRRGLIPSSTLWQVYCTLSYPAIANLSFFSTCRCFHHKGSTPISLNLLPSYLFVAIQLLNTKTRTPHTTPATTINGTKILATVNP